MHSNSGTTHAGIVPYSGWRGFSPRFHTCMGSFVRKTTTKHTLPLFSKHVWHFAVTNGDDNFKLNALFQFTNLNQVDLFAAAALNKCWDLLLPGQCLPSRMQGWWVNLHWSILHNWCNHHASAYQPGGAGIVVVNKFLHHTLHPGDDPLGLGHWCWVNLHGQHSQMSKSYPCTTHASWMTHSLHTSNTSTLLVS